MTPQPIAMYILAVNFVHLSTTKLRVARDWALVPGFYFLFFIDLEEY